MQVRTSRCRMAKMKHHLVHLDEEQLLASEFDMSKSPDVVGGKYSRLISSSFRVFFPDRSHKSRFDA